MSSYRAWGGGLLLAVILCVFGGVAEAAYDVTLNKSPSRSIVQGGQAITYTITLTNNGPDTANSIDLVDQLDSNVTYQNDLAGSCSYSNSSINLAGDELTVEGISLGAATNCSLTYSVVVDSDPATKDWMVLPHQQINVDGMSRETINFGHTYETVPVVLALPASTNNGDNYPIPVVRNVTTTGFELAVCVDEGGVTCASSPAAEDVHYFVVNRDLTAQYSRIDAGLAVVTTDGTDSPHSFGTTFSGIPSVWATPQTYNQGGNIAATVRVDDIGNSSANFVGCVHQGTSNSCSSGQPSESVGYLAIDLQAAAMSSFTGGVETITNSSWTPISYPSKVNPSVMVTVNDDAGSEDPKYPWARTVTSTSAEVRYCEADGVNSCDTHGSEETAWFVFDEFTSIFVGNSASLTATGDSNSGNNTATQQVVFSVCGNGIVEENESCDDANSNPNDSCPNDCGVCTDEDGDGVCADVDCDDADADEHPGQTRYKDQDADGYSDGSSLTQCERPSNYFVSSELSATTGDCQDADARMHPQTVWYKDADGDDYGDGTSITQCERPTDYYLTQELTNTNADCNDSNSEIHPSTTWYKDADGDTFGDGTSLVQCARPSDYFLTSELTTTSSDCNDSDGDEYPGQTRYKDTDTDQYSDGTTVVQCARPTNYYYAGELIGTGGDCDDSDGDEYPGQTWYKDVDGDDYSDGTTATQCTRPTDYYLSSELTSTSSDCDDTDINEHPGQTWYKDQDADQFGNGTSQAACLRPTYHVVQGELISTNGDCDDTDPNKNPVKAEVCDSIDNNCNGSIDEGGVCSLTFCTNTGVTIPQTECEALQTFYINLNGADWTTNTNWFQDEDVATRFGVTLTTVSGQQYVDTISLDNNNLAGSIPDEIGDLSWLTTLSADGNTIVSLASGVGNLTQLTTLSLDNNNISVLPDQIGNLAALITFSLQNNGLNQLPSTIGGLTALDSIDLDGNELTTLPSSVGDMDELDLLSVENNDIVSLPTELGDMADLDTLKLSFNSLTNLPTTLDGLSTLGTLEIDNNQLVDLPVNLSGLVALTTLSANNNSLTSLPAQFGELSSLTDLFVANNTLSSLPDTLEGLTSLETFDLRNNQLSSLPESFGTISTLDTLYAQNNQLTDLPASTTGLTSLFTLNLHGNQLAALPPELGSLSSIKFFYLYDNEMEGTLPLTYSGLDLFRFYIYNNNLDRDVDPSHNALIPTALSGWWSSMGGIKLIGNQGDVSAPTVTSTENLPLLVTTGFLYEITVSENSYTVDSAGSGMRVTFDGPAICSNLSTNTAITGKSTTVSVPITLGSTGVYSNCTLQVEDHGGNLSDGLTIDPFVYGTDQIDICKHPDMSVPQLECEALVLLYEETSGDNWKTSTNWLSSTDVESWFGVSTNIYNGSEHVDGIFLHKDAGLDQHGVSSQWVGNRLIGTLPPELGNLTRLKDFNVSKNSISGQLPSTFGNLIYLENFYALDNALNGTLSSTIGSLSALKVFNLANNQVGGSLPATMGNMTSLQAIDFSNNNFDGFLPDGLGNIDDLWFLRLNNNSLEGTIPSSLGSLSLLQYLYLNSNNFVGTLPSTFSNLTSISNFFVNGNYLDRDKFHDAIIPSSLTSWYQGFSSKNISSQGDITAPVIANSGSMASLFTGPVTIPLAITENSYPVDTDGNGMTVTVTGAGLCDTLPAGELTGNNGLQTTTLQVNNAGTYSGCALTVTDHGGNISNSITIPTFVYTDPQSLICYDINISIPEDECLELVNFYQQLDGDNWTDNSSWLSQASVNGRYGVTTQNVSGGHHVTRIELDANNLSGSLTTNFAKLPFITHLSLAQNSLTGSLPGSIQQLTHLVALDFQNNQFGGSLPSAYDALTSLQTLNVSNNSLEGPIPTVYGNMSSLQTFDVSYNNFNGDLPSWFGSLSGSLQNIIMEHNEFIGGLPDELSVYSSLGQFDVSHNRLDRDLTHDAVVQSGLQELLFSNTSSLDLSNQDDVTAPIVTSTDTIPETVSGAITYTIAVEENSYALDGSGNGMPITFGGTATCSTLSTSDSVTVQSSGSYDIAIVPSVEGEYIGCLLRVTDHAGNIGVHTMPNFTFEIGCGDGIIAGDEQCDEGRSCNDGTDCTNNLSLCPNECAPRFVDGCNPHCQLSSCGDGYVDTDGVDNLSGTSDDEVCDEGSYCNDGTPCEDDPSVCAGGAQECQPRLINGCSPTCRSPECGDGILDVDGPDDIMNTVDDEECDDGNNINGDGCSASCTTEYCGDGYVDSDGPDNTTGTSDDEACDLGINNGVYGGLCSSTCQDPDENCLPCWEVCYGGTGAHSIYLLIDRSGSMNGFDRLEEWQAAAIEFVSLLPNQEFDGSGNWISGSKVGLISFANSATVEIAPTNDFSGVIDEINDLSPGAQSNIADAIDLGKNYFDSNDLEAQHHMVLLSDGEPTKPGGKKNAGDNALASADTAKAAGINIYTVALQQGTKGAELLSGIASGPDFYFEDPDNEILTPIYQHIYGSIHCFCEPDEIICFECGNERVDTEIGEECDEGRYCADGTTECTDDPDLCADPDECKPRFIGNCTNMCEFTHCGDGVVQTPNYDGINEACDDGNQLTGDGCNASCQTEFCGDGYVDTDGPDNIWGNSDDEECDDGNNTNGDGCDASCQIEDPAQCGDGLVNQPEEECDDGNNTNGDGCSASCLHETPLRVPSEQSNSCIVGRLPTVMKDEYLPLWWTLIPRSNVDTSADSCAEVASGKYIPGGTLLCDFKILNGANPTDGATNINNVPCTDTSRNSSNSAMFADIPKNETYAPVLGNAYIDNIDLRVGNNYGQYKIILDSINYTVCNLDAGGGLQEESVTINTQICQMRATILESYLLQKGAPLSNIQNTNMSTFESVTGDKLATVSGDTLNQVVEKDYNPAVINYLTTSLLSNYKSQATADAVLYNVDRSGFTKVPSKEIYFYNGTQPLTISDEIVYGGEPFTLIVEQSDLIVEGDLAGRGMYVVPNGTITFQNQFCDQTDSVRGIFVAGNGFATSSAKNTDLSSSERCDGGNLIIEGVLVGQGITQSFAQQRRAKLDLRNTSVDMFTNEAHVLGYDLYMNHYKTQVENHSVTVDMQALKEAFVTLNVTKVEELLAPLAPDVYLLSSHRDQMLATKSTHQTKQKSRREELFDGAAVLIRSDPGLWEELPPGANEYRESIVISK